MAYEVAINDFVGSVVAGDWGPAYLAAKAALPAGGTIHLDTDTTVKTAVSMTSAAPPWNGWRFQGNGSNFIKFDMSGAAVGFNFGNAPEVIFRDVFLKGRREDETDLTVKDAGTAMAFSYCERVKFEGCHVGWLNTTNAGLWFGDAVFKAVFDTCKFGGGNGDRASIETTAAVTSLSVKHTDFIDHTSIRAFSGFRSDWGPHWIRATASADPTNSYRSALSVEDCSFDENSQCIYAEDLTQVTLDRVMSNNRRIELNGVKNASIHHSTVGYLWSDDPQTEPAVRLTDCGRVTIDAMQQFGGISKIEIDDLTDFVEVTNSPNMTIDADAGAKYSFNGIRYNGTRAQVG